MTPSDQRDRENELLRERLSRLSQASLRINGSRLLDLPSFAFALPGLIVARAVGNVAVVPRLLHPG